jgi:hypothetical protein
VDYKNYFSPPLYVINNQNIKNPDISLLPAYPLFCLLRESAFLSLNIQYRDPWQREKCGLMLEFDDNLVTGITTEEYIRKIKP